MFAVQRRHDEKVLTVACRHDSTQNVAGGPADATFRGIVDYLSP
ncbi:hypothetical protein [Adhaeretor mobilis]|nr:hypothetical protein [Adhaeretor mobilis]